MLYRRGRIWWFKFRVAGRLFQESTRTTSKTVAAPAERQRRRDLEERINGLKKRERPVAFTLAARTWLATREPTVARNSHLIDQASLKHLRPVFGHLLTCDIGLDEVLEYRQRRLREGASAKTFNLELGTLRSVLQRHRQWAIIQADAKQQGVRLTLRPRHDVGQTLGSDEEQRLLDACARSQAPYLLPIVVLGLLVGLRRNEIRLLRWWQVDVARRLITVGKTKTESGSGRQLPLNGRATAVLEFWADQWPRRRPEHYVFPAIRSGVQADSTRPMGGWNRAWQTAQQSAKIRRRLHDLRHALVTRLLENGVPFSVVATLLGWSTSTTVAMSRRYRHISDAAKRWAVETLDQLGEPATGQSTNLDVSEDVRVN